MNLCDTPEKQVNRDLIRRFVLSNTSVPAKKLKVACLPGPKFLEVLNLWDECGVLRKNIYAFSNDVDELSLFQSKRVNAINFDIINWECDDLVLFYKYLIVKNGNKKRPLKKIERFFHIVYMDLYSNFTQNALLATNHFVTEHLKSGGFGGVSFYGCRERAKICWEELGFGGQGVSARRSNFLLWYLLEYSYRNGKVCTDLIRTKYIANGSPMYTVFGKFRSKKSYPTKVFPKKMSSLYFSKFLKNRLYKISSSDVERAEKESEKSEIVEFLKDGIPSAEIAEAYNLSTQTVAAYKAHLTMGTYN